MTFGFLEADHLDPRKKFDGDYAEEYDINKVTACCYCNKKKGNYEPKGETVEAMVADASREIQERMKSARDWFMAVKK